MAVQYPDQVRRLVYLDAGFDYHTHKIPQNFPPLPAMSAADSASPAAGLAYTQRVSGAPTTESDYRATEHLSPTGRDLGPASPPSFSDQVVASATAIAPPLAKIRVPVLAIYDWPTTAAEALLGSLQLTRLPRTGSVSCTTGARRRKTSSTPRFLRRGSSCSRTRAITSSSINPTASPRQCEASSSASAK